MARIPDEEIERLKKEVSLERLAEARGVVLTRHGADLIGLCPFHDDRGPSLVITPDKNLWHCLGACQAGGSGLSLRASCPPKSAKLSSLPPVSALASCPSPKRCQRRCCRWWTSR